MTTSEPAHTAEQPVQERLVRERPARAPGVQERPALAPGAQERPARAPGAQEQPPASLLLDDQLCSPCTSRPGR